MNDFLKRLSWRLVIGLVVCAFQGPARAARAQDGDDAPAGTGAKVSDKKDEAPKPEDDVAVTPPSDPQVQAVLATNPKTPAELLRAAKVLVDLGAAPTAHPLVKQLLDAQLDEAALAALEREFGPAVFLKLALARYLQPEGKQLADAVLKAADRRARNPQRIAELIRQLDDELPYKRHAAVVELCFGGEDAVSALVAVLADPKQSERHTAVRGALVGLDRLSLGATEAIAVSAEGSLAAQACEVLGRLGEPTAALELLAPALSRASSDEVRQAAQGALKRLIGRLPDRDEAVAALARRALEYYNGRPEIGPDESSSQSVVVWRWDTEKSQLLHEPMAPRVADLAAATQLAEAWLSLDPQSAAARRVYLGSRLEADAWRAGIDAPAPESPASAEEDLATRSVAVVADLLAHSLTDGHNLVARAAARTLGRIGKSDLLYVGQPRPSALVRAARSSDRRLRFVALQTIVALKPTRPYPGSSFVLEALGYFASAYGAPRALVADARPAELEKLAGVLASLGYETEMANTARDALVYAVASPDFELALIDMSLAGATSGQLLQQFRRDNRTARLPIGILASSEDLRRAEQLAERTPWSARFIRTEDAAALDGQIQRLLSQEGYTRIGADERRRQASQALDWLAELAASSSDVYNLRRIEPALSGALWSTELSPRAAQLMARLGTASSQRALVDLVSQLSQPLEMRQAAAQAFAHSIADFGTLLTTAEIQLQYSRYNASETQDKATQQLLASILDALESRAGAQRAKADE